jgi:hypothetical protein
MNVTRALAPPTESGVEKANEFDRLDNNDIGERCGEQ